MNWMWRQSIQNIHYVHGISRRKTKLNEWFFLPLPRICLVFTWCTHARLFVAVWKTVSYFYFSEIHIHLVINKQKNLPIFSQWVPAIIKYTMTTTRMRLRATEWRVCVCVCMMGACSDLLICRFFVAALLVSLFLHKTRSHKTRMKVMASNNDDDDDVELL